MHKNGVNDRRVRGNNGILTGYVAIFSLPPRKVSGVP